MTTQGSSAYLPVFEYYPEDEEELRIKLSILHSSIASAINIREIALYQDGQQITTGQLFSNAGTQSQSFRKTFYFGAIAPGVTHNIAHGLSGITLFTKILGGLVTANDFRPLPYVSATLITDQVGVLVDGTNVIIINGATAPPITNGVVVLEYLYS